MDTKTLAATKGLRTRVFGSILLQKRGYNVHPDDDLSSYAEHLYDATALAVRSPDKYVLKSGEVFMRATNRKGSGPPRTRLSKPLRLERSECVANPPRGDLPKPCACYWCTTDRPDVHLVYFDGSFTAEVTKSVKALLDESEIQHLIVVTSQSPLKNMTNLADLNAKVAPVRVEVIHALFLQGNILDNIDQTIMVEASPAAKAALETRVRTKDNGSNFPAFNEDDPVVQLMGWRRGTLVFIFKPTPSGFVPSCRIVYA